ncbi:MAG: redoxin domain-containing protein [Planctomycetota bacterium]
MIRPGSQAPAFELDSHLDTKVALSDFAGKKNVLLVFYPLDFTPTGSIEIPGLQAIKDRFEAADTQVLGVSVDSKYCHKAWADSFGKIEYPLLADFHPKGAMAKTYGAWLEDAGITDRATVLVGKDGKVLWSESVGPGGARQPMDLLKKCQELGQK